MNTANKINVSIFISMFIVFFYYIFALKYLFDITPGNSFYIILLIFTYPVVSGIVFLLLSIKQKNKIGIYLSITHIFIPFIAIISAASFWTVAGFLGHY